MKVDATSRLPLSKIEPHHEAYARLLYTLVTDHPHLLNQILQPVSRPIQQRFLLISKVGCFTALKSQTGVRA
ncbi:unnamed protein product [Trifolium pratense]|uniref:Uncharacterized protein n=1 Tax=Trifolium pratense TaxID=57577 RepID=A0ACB0KBM1_TRIPR|nr:unnamed protein product [Trifolium pratense]